jgi:putative sterol carrier protein
LLDLPAPSAAAQGITGREAASGILQVHLTGPGGEDWYVIAEKGRTTRHQGTATRPDAAVTVSADDWAAIQRGEINPFNAWTSGKLKVAGDHALYQQLADVIARL